MMKLLPLLSVSSLLCACGSPPQNPSSVPSANEGVWIGTIKAEQQLADESRSTGESKLVLAICGSVLRVLTADDQGKLTLQKSGFTTISNLDSHLFYFVRAAAKQPDWVEIQTYSFVQLSESVAHIHWSRSVSNRDAGPSEPDRFFVANGSGKFHKGTSSCPK